MKSEKLTAHLVEAAHVIKFNLLALNSHSKNKALRVETCYRSTLRGDINIKLCKIGVQPSALNPVKLRIHMQP